ncbi:MAG TPA: zf-HC2 domain-containing protein [Vicinamibacterales bacterium]|nr:zf-HC2 domain-containing protein [Vicinamibacterales bacterium]
MCDKERLVSYLYDDLADAERAAFERHVRDCGECRAELNALRGVRADLISWSPPQPDFGFRVVREPKVLPMRPSWRARWTPAAGLAAAAVLVLAIASAIARVEISSGPQGFTVRTGWSAAPGAPERPQAARRDVPLPASAAAGDAALIESLDRRLRALETAVREPGLVRNASLSARSRDWDAEIIRRVREMLAQSESRQQGELALRIAQVLRDVDAQRVEDLKRIQQGLRSVEATVNAEAAGHREVTNYILARQR